MVIEVRACACACTLLCVPICMCTYSLAVALCHWLCLMRVLVGVAVFFNIIHVCSRFSSARSLRLGCWFVTYSFWCFCLSSGGGGRKKLVNFYFILFCIFYLFYFILFVCFIFSWFFPALRWLITFSKLEKISSICFALMASLLATVSTSFCIFLLLVCDWECLHVCTCACISACVVRMYVCVLRCACVRC